jgi:hypothetical protein
MTTSSQPDASAIRSSNRRSASDSFSNISIIDRRYLLP